MKRKKIKNDQAGSIKRSRNNEERGAWEEDDGIPAVLRLYYPQVLTLREYLVQMTANSKNKKRRIHNYGVRPDRCSAYDHPELVKILDTVLVGCHSLKDEQNDPEIQDELSNFSTQEANSNYSSSNSQSGLAFAEVGWQIPSTQCSLDHETYG